MKRAICAAALLSGAIARADSSPPLARLERALPRGWSLITTDTALVIRHDGPVYVVGEHLPNEPAGSPPTGVPAGGPLITLELRYRLEPKWSAKQLADARATNAKLGSQLRALAVRFRIDEMPSGKGRPLPHTDDESDRLAAYEAARAPLEARLVKLPRCTFGASSLFDGPDTYAQLSLSVDPEQAMTEAYAVVELVKKQCGAS
jgi:hypothetical protein